MFIKSLAFILFLLPSLLMAITMDEQGRFSARISKVNDVANLLRVNVTFDNVKYLTKHDAVDFWGEGAREQSCRGVIVGKSNDYLLLKVQNFPLCRKLVYLNSGVLLNFYSQDLVNNIKMGHEVINILLKKRAALDSKFKDSKVFLESYIGKVDAINSRYQVLREKLEKEWRDELHAIEEDRLVALRNNKDLEHRLDEVDYKLAKYHISDRNRELDRWSLDSQLFFEK